jgi:hypothetical protein
MAQVSSQAGTSPLYGAPMVRLLFSGMVVRALMLVMGLASTAYFRYQPSDTEAAGIQQRFASFLLHLGMLVLPVSGAALVLTLLIRAI